MTRKPGAISGRSLDPKRTRRNQQKATIITGDKLLPPIREDAQGRISVKPLPRVESIEAATADPVNFAETQERIDATNAKLALLIDYLKEAGYME